MPATSAGSSSKTVEKFAHRASLEEIRANEWKLNIPRYVDAFEEEAEINLPAIQQETGSLEAHLTAVRTGMCGHLKKLGLTPKVCRKIQIGGFDDLSSPNTRHLRRFITNSKIWLRHP